MNAHDQAALQQAQAILEAGGLVGFATETVWALGCDARQPTAVAALYAAKSRPQDKAFQLLCADVQVAHAALQLDATLTRRLNALSSLWPGPLTVVAPASSVAPAPLVHHGRIGVRVPDHAGAQEILQRVGGTLATTSLNLSGAPAASTFAQAQAYALADYLLPGPDAAGLASTVVDLVSGTLLRVGAVPEARVQEALACAR